VTRSSALLAAVRDASAGTEPGMSATAPYGADQWLFSHNGTFAGWPAAAAGLAATLTPLELLGLDARVDSALLLGAHAEAAARRGLTGAALAAVIGPARRGAGQRPVQLPADRRHEDRPPPPPGHSLFYRRVAGDAGTSVVVASEPADEEPGWVEVPDPLAARRHPRPRSPCGTLEVPAEGHPR